MSIKEYRKDQWENGDSYLEYINEELSGFRKQAWKDQILAHFCSDRPLKILDVGTGPGFFACILSEEGHLVTGIDRSQGMLSNAINNAKRLNVYPIFYKMDINDLKFEDNTFDAVISRNVTWTLERPAEVYSQFKRILKPGGKLLIYDANWHMHFYDEELMKQVRRNEREYLNIYHRERKVASDDTRWFIDLPLSNTYRPQWDVKALREMGFEDIIIAENIGEKVYEEWEKGLYATAPCSLSFRRLKQYGE
ncbi:class I SAM-dependent methyltransferase [Desulfosporosinus sp.]|uniref:class I SAM-dependent methyltransferase n=1 Tax=Desulfosporosinus sp. TaxID=157907 RepID=UPI00262869FA|nr:class I SAM-dependent methyltransferase [Desulfosporosinus sp.]MCO5385273.1 class I SAM-dependent methyltransferase [Desulfosporosinus sp.]